MFGTIDLTWTPPSWLTSTGKRVERIVALTTDIVWDIDKAVTDIVVSDAASAQGVLAYHRNRIQRLVHIIGLETGKTVYAARRIGLAVACQVAYDAAVGTNTEVVRDRTIDLVQTLLDTYDERASWMTDYRADACKNGWLLVLDALTLTSTSRYWLAATLGGSEAPVHLSDAEKETVGKTISDALQNGDYDTVKGVFGEPHSDFLTGGRVQCQNRLPDAYYAAHPEEKEEDEVDGMEFVTRGYLKDGEAYVMPEHDMHDTVISKTTFVYEVLHLTGEAPESLQEALDSNLVGAMTGAVTSIDTHELPASEVRARLDEMGFDRHYYDEYLKS